jgi:hypothetical protein
MRQPLPARVVQDLAACKTTKLHGTSTAHPNWDPTDFYLLGMQRVADGIRQPVVDGCEAGAVWVANIMSHQS